VGDNDSGYHEIERDLVHDDAAELYEDDEELKREGVTVLHSAEHKSSRPTVHRAAPAAAPPVCELKVGICARCARVIEGGLSNDHASDSIPHTHHQPQLAKSDVSLASLAQRSDTVRSVREFLQSDDDDDDDEEIESVSQVSGPRRPVWHDDSDSEGQRAKRVSASTKSLPAARHLEGDHSFHGKKPSSRAGSAVGSTTGRLKATTLDADRVSVEDDRRSGARSALSGSAWPIKDDNDSDDSTAYVTGSKPKKTSSKTRVY